MPIHRGKDSYGVYYQWGNQKKYYSRDFVGSQREREDQAWECARKQEKAIYSSGYTKRY